MKILILLNLVLSTDLAFANKQMNKPTAPLIINCTDENGTQKTVRVMELYFDSKSGRSFGQNFGPDRGDEGFLELKGQCDITTDFVLKN